MLLTVLAAFVLLLVVVLIAAASRPDTFRVQRQAVMNAPPERIFQHLDDFHRWAEWSPWEKLDPGLKRTHSGAPSGKGAAYAWEGNPKVGSGRMEVRESVPPSRLVIQLDFLKPFEAHNQAEFTLVPEGPSTRVEWAMTGPQAFPMKVMGLFMSMDSMVGKDFEKGLASLKEISERQAS
ncbi:MAG: SRPBCC family protein [Vicinamibacteria bacterium]|nr:SRPBCC family protein [Vicinamibacteria bacterium]